MPTLMVASIRRLYPSARVIQCSDMETPAVPGTSEVFRLNFADQSNLMLNRVLSFRELGMSEPAAYVDTDIIWMNKVDLSRSLGERHAVLCERSLNKGNKFNWEFNGLSFPEHQGKTMYEAFPYIGCFTISQDHDFWRVVLESYNSLDDRYLRWYGDQEALRMVAENASKLGLKIGSAKESLLACLPEFYKPGEPVVSLHFKGAERKKSFEVYAEEFRLRSYVPLAG